MISSSPDFPISVSSCFLFSLFSVPPKFVFTETGVLYSFSIARTAVRTNFGGTEKKENRKQEETEIVKSGDEEIIYRKSNDEEKDVEMKEVMDDMTEANDDVASLKSLCLLLQVQPNPVNINILTIIIIMTIIVMIIISFLSLLQ